MLIEQAVLSIFAVTRSDWTFFWLMYCWRIVHRSTSARRRGCKFGWRWIRQADSGRWGADPLSCSWPTRHSPKQFELQPRSVVAATDHQKRRKVHERSKIARLFRGFKIYILCFASKEMVALSVPHNSFLVLLGAIKIYKNIPGDDGVQTVRGCASLLQQSLPEK